MARIETIGNATLYLGDCREILSALRGVDAVVTDPPYGIDYDPAAYNKKSTFKKIEGDKNDFDPAPFLSYQHVILWGANNYSSFLPRGGWLCWDKRTIDGSADRVFGSPFELAWVNNVKRFAMARILHGGFVNADGPGMPREHPTQKPIAIMYWCIRQLSPAPQTILDPFMGSGTTGIAALRLNRKFIGIEIDEVHFATACRRIEEASRQGDMFQEEVPMQPESETPDFDDMWKQPFDYSKTKLDN